VSRLADPSGLRPASAKGDAGRGRLLHVDRDADVSSQLIADYTELTPGLGGRRSHHGPRCSEVGPPPLLGLDVVGVVGN